jgi:hypothetical protein
MAQTYNTVFRVELQKAIAEHRASMSERMAAGAFTDFYGYREQVGYIRALDRVAQMCDEVETEMAKR